MAETTAPPGLASALAKYVTTPKANEKPELLLFYSPPGGGKTHLALTSTELADVKKVLYLDVEGSTVGVMRHFDRNKVDVIRLDKMEPDRAIALFDSIMRKLEDGDTTYDIVGVDTFDALQALKRKEVIAAGVKGWDIWDEVGSWSIQVATTLKKIEPLGILVVHEREAKATDGSVLSKLRIMGQAQDALPGIPDVVVYLERLCDAEDNGKEVTLAHVATDGTRVTKNRFGFPPVLKDVTLPVLWKFIDNNNKEK